LFNNENNIFGVSEDGSVVDDDGCEMLDDSNQAIESIIWI